MNSLFILLLLFNFSYGMQNFEGLKLKNANRIAIIPYGEKITVYSGDGNKKIEGELFNVSQKKIYLKGTEAGSTVSIPKREIIKIEGKAIPKTGRNFWKGCIRGSFLGASISYLFIASMQKKAKAPEPYAAALLAGILIPPATVLGGIIGGGISMGKSHYAIKSINMFKIDNENWMYYE